MAQIMKAIPKINLLIIRGLMMSVQSSIPREQKKLARINPIGIAKLQF